MWDLDDFADDVRESLAELAAEAGVELTGRASGPPPRRCVREGQARGLRPRRWGSRCRCSVWRPPRARSRTPRPRWAARRRRSPSRSCSWPTATRSCAWPPAGTASTPRRWPTRSTWPRCARPQADEVRAATGFAIGGVPPFGHDLPVLFDEELLSHERVWAAAGRPAQPLLRGPARAGATASGARVVRPRRRSALASPYKASPPNPVRGRMTDRPRRIDYSGHGTHSQRTPSRRSRPPGSSSPRCSSCSCRSASSSSRSASRG